MSQRTRRVRTRTRRRKRTHFGVRRRRSPAKMVRRPTIRRVLKSRGGNITVSAMDGNTMVTEGPLKGVALKQEIEKLLGFKVGTQILTNNEGQPLQDDENVPESVSVVTTTVENYRQHPYLFNSTLEDPRVKVTEYKRYQQPNKMNTHKKCASDNRMTHIFRGEWDVEMELNEVLDCFPDAFGTFQKDDDCKTNPGEYVKRYKSDNPIDGATIIVSLHYQNIPHTTRHEFEEFVTLKFCGDTSDAILYGMNTFYGCLAKVNENFNNKINVKRDNPPKNVRLDQLMREIYNRRLTHVKDVM